MNVSQPKYGDGGIKMQPLLAEGDKVLIEKRGLQIVDMILPPSKDAWFRFLSKPPAHYTETSERDGSWQSTTS